MYLIYWTTIVEARRITLGAQAPSYLNELITWRRRAGVNARGEKIEIWRFDGEDERRNPPEVCWVSWEKRDEFAARDLGGIVVRLSDRKHLPSTFGFFTGTVIAEPV